ncbi:hypothetical protein AMJ87_02090 [candidate division WOR_3 bacterium SM23_60]|uniref:M23ase beta-sheet core domain-containing protein n=1 Tax=candidate division WOR_3 bacterium SM23_60 TaxID=1703780 RepID=A0A0S8GJX0_UNCW3|nr:MAG: hypothetical protein AMJ87_02090 [candidate division WOR_3 bacterium SM23_60]
MIFLFVLALAWPLAPVDSMHALGNNWGEYQEYGGWPYMHPGIDVMGITVGKPVYAVDSGVVKAWLTTSGVWHWRLAIADYETVDSVEAWLYAHIDSARYHKNVGDYVAAGELIGYLVEWPIFGFDHLHFARIKDAGAVWEYGDWAFIQNPLVIIEPYNDTTEPVFENAIGNNRFAFCVNNTSTYLQPDSLYGNVDIIAKIYDDNGLPLLYPVWERLIPYQIEYEIRGPVPQPTRLSFIFYGVLRWTENIEVIYKDDAVCDSRGDYDYRDYYFIVTNTDGDSVVESSDAVFSWVTTDYPDGDYWIIVTAYDAANNDARDSMLVSVKNAQAVNEQIVQSCEDPLRKLSNPVSGPLTIPTEDDVLVFDVSGRLITSHQSATALSPGVYFVVFDRGAQVFTRKIVVISD